MVDTEARAATADRQLAHLRGHPVWHAMPRIPADERAALQGRFHALCASWITVEPPGTVIDAARTDIRSSRATCGWAVQQMQETIARADTTGPAVDSVTEVVVRSEDIAGLVPRAQDCRLTWRPGCDQGRCGPPPKVGALTRGCEAGGPRFSTPSVVDGAPGDHHGPVVAFLALVEATKTLNALDRAWPSTVVIPHEDRCTNGCEWHATEVTRLAGIVGAAAEIQREERRLAQLGLPAPDWADNAALSG